MSTLKSVGNKLFKTDLATQKVELAINDDVQKAYNDAIAARKKSLDVYMAAKKAVDDALTEMKNLKAINEIAKYGLDCFEKEASIQHIGKLLDESWQHKKQLSDGLSPKWMEELYDTAIRHGAFGGKLMGAGGGGFFYFIAPNNKHQKIKEALNGIKVWVPFKFAKDGSKIISI